jgi:hypothetical protein
MNGERSTQPRTRRPAYACVFAAGIAAALGAVLAGTVLGMPVAWPLLAAALSLLVCSAFIAARSRQVAAILASAIACGIVAAVPWLPVWEVHGDIGGRMHGHTAVGPPHGEKLFRRGHVH